MRTQRGQLSPEGVLLWQLTRTVALPVPVKEDEISAEYKNGVLSIRLPKSEEAKRKRINVNIS